MSELKETETEGEDTSVVYTGTGTARDSVLLADASAAASNRRASVIQAMEEMRRRAQRYSEAPDDEAERDILQGINKELHAKQLALYDKIFRDHPISVGKAISKKEREDSSKTLISTLVYGEISFDAFAIAVHKIKNRYGLPGVNQTSAEGCLQAPGGIFVDVGSGTGKPSVAAAILHDFQRCIGIEILEGLYRTSMEIKGMWEGGMAAEAERSTELEFWHGDAFDWEVADWRDADVVFANSTCFSDDLMHRMARCCEDLKLGAFVITFTKKLPSAHFNLLEFEMYQMSWGGNVSQARQGRKHPLISWDPHAFLDHPGATVFIQQKKVAPGEQP